jgi:hypothetical protein
MNFPRLRLRRSHDTLASGDIDIQKSKNNDS